MSRLAAPVGYYVHHHGAGHAAAATAAAAVLGERIVGLGSGPPPAGWPGRWVPLGSDADPPPRGDATRGGAWHWAPAGHAGFSDRMRTIAGWIAEAEPAALVVDVSAEVVALGVLLGVPTAAVMMHGRRDDRPHRRAWDCADAVVAPWPAAHAEPWQAPWRPTTTHLGLTSRFDGRPPPPPGTGRTVTVLLPSGGHGIAPEQVEDAARATAADGWRWEVLGSVDGPARPGSPVSWHGRVADPWPHLGAARVVVAACGSGSVADIAAARRPAVLLPQPRPFDEQVAFAGHLAGHAPVAVHDRWPADDEWATVLAATAALDGEGWATSHDGRGAHRLVALVDRLGTGRMSPGTCG